MKLLTLHAECTYELCQSIYLSIYPFIYLHIFIYIWMCLYLYLSFYLSLLIYDHNKTVLFSDGTVEALAKTKYTLFWKWCHFMVNICFNWHFFITSKVYIITIKWHNFQNEYKGRFGKNREVLHFENYVIVLWNINF